MDADIGTVGRVARMGMRAGQIYATRAAEETQDALRAVIVAAVLGGVALAFGILGLGFAHGLVFALLTEAGVPAWQVCAGFLTADLLAAAAMALAARAQLGRPVLPETRRSLHELSVVLRG